MVEGKGFLERKLSELRPFTDGSKERTDNPLTGDIVKVLNFADNLNDATLGDMIQKFLHHEHLDVRQDNSQKIIYLPAALETLAEMTAEELTLHEKYRYAFNIAKYTSHASTAIGMILVSGAGRITMKKLDDDDKPGKGGIKLDPIDKMQLFDFVLKGIACTAYQLVRCAPEHDPAIYKQLHGIDLWKQVGSDLYTDAKTAFVEVGRNPYNRQFWMGYFIFDGLLNLPAHFIASGKPLSEMELAAETFKDSVVEHGQDLVNEVKNVHLPFIGEHHRGGVESILNTIVPKSEMDAGVISNLAAQGVSTAISVLDPQHGDAIAETIKRGGNAFGAEYGKRRDHWDKVYQKAQSGGGRSTASIITGGLLEGAIAGIDAMGIYRSMARKDITYDALSRAYKEYLTKNGELPRA